MVLFATGVSDGELWYYLNMKRYRNTYSIIGSLVIVAVMIIFSVYTTKCHGDSCNPKPILEEEKQVLLFPKMIPEIISKQVENNEIFLLDVRDNSEWNTGHIAGAKHIALDNLDIRAIMNIPKDVPVLSIVGLGKGQEKQNLSYAH